MQSKSTLNPRQERFCQLISFGNLPIGEACKQAGYSARSARSQGPELLKNPAIASRINQLKREAEQPAGTRSIQSITRQELAELLAKVIKAGFSKPEKAGPHDALKASELLTKLCGWNEPENIQHNHLHVTVNSTLMNELRAGYAALTERKEKALPLPDEPGVIDIAATDGSPHPAIPPKPRSGHPSAKATLSKSIRK
jgi:Terminase small subunit